MQFLKLSARTTYKFCIDAQFFFLLSVPLNFVAVVVAAAVIIVLFHFDLFDENYGFFLCMQMYFLDDGFCRYCLPFFSRRWILLLLFPLASRILVLINRCAYKFLFVFFFVEMCNIQQNFRITRWCYMFYVSRAWFSRLFVPTWTL